MKLYAFLILLTPMIFIGCKSGNQEEKKETSSLKEAPTKSEIEPEDTWVTLFDGASLDGWTGWESPDPPNVWSATDDGLLYCRALDSDDAKPGDKGYLVSESQYENFHLKLEWKISEGGNSGIFYLGDKSLGGLTSSAPEMQVLDNDKHPDAKKGKDGNRKAGSLYDLIPADPQNTKPVGEWNLAEVIVKDRHVIHKMNGETVVEFDLDTEEWKELVSDSKFPDIRDDWHQVPQNGYLALQDHHNDVWFRNIMIKRL